MVDSWELCNLLQSMIGRHVFVVQEGEEGILDMGKLLSTDNGAIEIEGASKMYEIELTGTETNMRVDGDTIIVKEA